MLHIGVYYNDTFNADLTFYTVDLVSIPNHAKSKFKNQKNAISKTINCISLLQKLLLVKDKSQPLNHYHFLNIASCLHLD